MCEELRPIAGTGILNILEVSYSRPFFLTGHPF